MRNKKRVASLLLLGITTSVGLVCRHSPQIGEWYFAHTPLRCPLKEWFGLSCAFCGMTHAWFYFCQGEFKRAFQANALFFPLVTLALTVLVANACAQPIKLKPRPKTLSLWASLIVLSAYVIVRNGMS